VGIDMDEIDWDTEDAEMTPDEQVRMYRTQSAFDGGEVTETVTFSRYDAERWVIASYPRVQLRTGGEFVGTTTEWAIPRDQDIAAFMANRIAIFERSGWIVADPASITLKPRTAEPWEKVDPADGPCPF
jgi:hypothetical protein